jgi:diguanylate cyclase (GGDEF)-like protein
MGDDDFSSTDERTLVGDRNQLIGPKGAERDHAYVIVIAGPVVGEMFRIDRTVHIGRGTDADIRLSDTEISRKHARLLHRDGSVVVEDLKSTNGTFVNGATIGVQRLNDGDKIQVGTTTILKFSYHDDLEEQFQRQMYESALRDGLTKAFNKKYFAERLRSEVAYSKRHRAPMCLLMLDLDHFKKINDTYGHLAGDHVLARFAEFVQQRIRKEDVFARYGGEEFALICRGIPLDEGFQLADRLRDGIAQLELYSEGRRLPVTVSIGVAAMPDAPASKANELVACADKALYAAKRAGRNRCEVFSAQ